MVEQESGELLDPITRPVRENIGNVEGARQGYMIVVGASLKIVIKNKYASTVVILLPDAKVTPSVQLRERPAMAAKARTILSESATRKMLAQGKEAKPISPKARRFEYPGSKDLIKLP